jgi:hypothetical protein
LNGEGKLQFSLNVGQEPNHSLSSLIAGLAVVMKLGGRLAMRCDAIIFNNTGTDDGVGKEPTIMNICYIHRQWNKVKDLQGLHQWGRGRERRELWPSFLTATTLLADAFVPFLPFGISFFLTDVYTLKSKPSASAWATTATSAKTPCSRQLYFSSLLGL